MAQKEFEGRVAFGTITPTLRQVVVALTAPWLVLLAERAGWRRWRRKPVAG